MNHLSEEQVVLHHYQDDSAEEHAQAAQHLAECAECAQELRRISAVLSAVNEQTFPVPQRTEDHGREVWSRIHAQLPAKRPRSDWRAWFAPRRLVFAGSAIALLIVAFLAGRVSKPGPTPGGETIAHEKVRDRILLVNVGDHLEKTQMMLIELSNTDAQGGRVDIGPEQQQARELLAANRLYEQSARKYDEPAVRSVLDDLERVLVEVANSPEEMSAAQLRQIQEQIDAQGLLLKVRVINAKVNSKLKQDRQESGLTGKGKQTQL